MDLIRLGVNIDHVATLRNARGGVFPDPIEAAKIAETSGADGITAHLREDRRHIKDNDIYRLVTEVDLPLNFEMAATQEMLDIAAEHRPHAACIVPEKREEITTEGGLNVVGQLDRLRSVCHELLSVGTRVSLFIEADERQIVAAAELGVPVIEIHAGAYSDAEPKEQLAELEKIKAGIQTATDLGLECHVGHGLNYQNVERIAEIKNVAELNIGHFLIGDAVFNGLSESIKKMRCLIDNVRV
tara:strand:+ start:2754 stop:3482 length:729 start_codon:yes stop_codon:yes gene_type:complete